jgi:hypothetical protein
MDGIETATDSLERHHHLQQHPENRHAKRMALLIGILAAALAICEMGEKSAQNSFLARQIALNDDWGFYQAKSVKSDIAALQSAVLGALGRMSHDKSLLASAAVSDARAAKLTSDPAGREGKVQLKAQATTDAAMEEHQLERYHYLEIIVGALQIAIVLASVSVVTEVVGFGVLSVVLGGLSFIAGIVVMAFV